MREVRAQDAEGDFFQWLKAVAEGETFLITRTCVNDNVNKLPCRCQ